jgi:DNA invertase Pin-like site-specific DNA recombinase
MTFDHPRQDLTRDVALVLRQSTKIQKVDNPGSGELQPSALGLPTDLWPADRITTFAARGESGFRRRRHLIPTVLDAIYSGLVGAIAFMRRDRLDRTALESEKISRAVTNHGILLIMKSRAPIVVDATPDQS